MYAGAGRGRDVCALPFPRRQPGWGGEALRLPSIFPTRAALPPRRGKLRLADTRRVLSAAGGGTKGHRTSSASRLLPGPRSPRNGPARPLDAQRAVATSQGDRERMYFQLPHIPAWPACSHSGPPIPKPQPPTSAPSASDSRALSGPQGSLPPSPRRTDSLNGRGAPGPPTPRAWS